MSQRRRKGTTRLRVADDDAVVVALEALVDRIDGLGHEEEHPVPAPPSGVVVPNWAMTVFLTVITASVIGLGAFVMEARTRLAVLESDWNNVVVERLNEHSERITSLRDQVNDLHTGR